MKVLKSSVIYVVLGFLPMAVNFLLSPLYSHWLSPEENALLAKAAIYQSFLLIFISLSIDSAFNVFYFDLARKKRLLSGFLSSLVTFILLVSVVLLLILLPFGNTIFNFFQRTNDFTFDQYGIWIFLTAVFTTIQGILLFNERNREKPISYSAIALAYFFLSLIFTLTGILVFKMQAYGIIAGRALAYGIVTVILLVRFYREYNFFFKIKFIKRSLSYSLPLVPYLILMALYGNIDRIMIEKNFESTKVLGIYTFAFSLAGVVSVFLSSVQNVQIPIVYKLLAYPSKENEYKLNEVIKFFHFVIVSVIVVGLAVAVIFIKLTFALQYHEIVAYLGILFLSYIFRTYYVLYADSLFYFKKTKLVFVITLFSFLIGFGVMTILIPKWGIPGVCVSVMIINFIQCVGALIFLKLNKLNTKFYRMSFNHFYTFFVLLTYFLSRHLLAQAGLPVIYCNFFPCIITLLFSLYYFYQKKGFILLQLQFLFDKYKWMRPLSIMLKARPA